jgi:hypothetical protein
MDTPIYQQLLLLQGSSLLEFICQLLKRRPKFQEGIKAILTCLLLLDITIRWNTRILRNLLRENTLGQKLPT